MNDSTETVSPQELYNVVSGAASQDPRLISASASRLKEMLNMPGTLDGLSEITGQRNIPLSIRQQSIIQLKNSAFTHWKSKRLLTDEQRQSIRMRSLALISEEDDIISECNKYVISKIARTDFPSKWPNLIENIVVSTNEGLQAFMASSGSDLNGAMMARRSLDILHAILKEYASIKMPSGIKAMAQLVENLPSLLQSHYSLLSSNFASIINPVSINSKFASDTIYLSHITFKCLGVMVSWVWQRQASRNQMELVPWAINFLESSIIHLETVSELRLNFMMSYGNILPQGPADPMAARSLQYLTRHVLRFGKLFRRLLELSAANFVKLNISGELVLYYWNKVVQATNGPSELIADSQWAVFPVRFLARALVIFKEVLGHWNPSKQSIIGNAAFSKEFVAEATKVLVIRFIPLHPKDLNAWLADPEEWMNVEDKDNDLWEYELRPCAERVLMTLANRYEEYVAPLLAETFKQIIGVPVADLEGAIQREALYCAIGRCAQRVKNVIPFNEWIARNLRREAMDTNPNSPILKRRIAWVLGKWIQEDCTPPNTDIWDILLHLLSDRGSGTDAVVRFTASSALRECIDSLQFNPDIFLPYLSTTVTQLIQLSAEADTLEMKRRIAQSLNVVIERMDIREIPYVNIIADSIPSLWNSAEGDFLYKGVLLETVTTLVQASKEHSPALNAITIPLIQESLSDQSRLALDEDGLRLWAAVLRNATSLSSPISAPSLYDVLPIVLSLLSENLDILGPILNVLRSYFVIGAEQILQSHALSLFTAFVKALSQARDSNQKDMIVELQLLVQLSSSRTWAGPMHTSEHVCLFARMALSDATVLSQLIAATAVDLNTSESELWNGLLDQWWRRFDNMSEPKYRKLLAMGMACLVSTGRPEVLERFGGEISNLWLDVFGEMKEALAEISEGSQESTLSPLITFWRDDGKELPIELEEVKGSSEYERWKEIYRHDPVEREKLTMFVAQKVQQAQNVCGGPQAFETSYLRDIDPGVLKQLREELFPYSH